MKLITSDLSHDQLWDNSYSLKKEEFDYDLIYASLSEKQKS